MSHTKSIAVKEDLPAVSERLDNVIEPKVKHFEYEMDTLPVESTSRSRESHRSSQQSSRTRTSDTPKHYSANYHRPRGHMDHTIRRRDGRRSRSRDGHHSRSRDGHWSHSRDDHQSRRRDGHRSRSRDGHQSRSRDGHLSLSRDDHQFLSRSGYRSRSRDGHRSRSRDGHRPRSRDDHRPRSRDDHRPRSRDDHRSRSRDGHRSRSRDGHRSLSRDGHRSRSRDGHRSRSRDSQRSRVSDKFSPLSDSLDRLGNMHNTIPEFDPCQKKQTMLMWLDKVNELATVYGWTEKQVIQFALPKLKGVAQRWYEGQASVLYSWSEWQTKLQSAFPSEENYAQTLSDMLAKRARVGESLETYFHDKLALVNRCCIVGKRAVDCILHGIDDRTVRLGAEAVQYDDPDKLFAYLRSVNNIKTNSECKVTKFKGQNINKTSGSSTTTANKKQRCYNCRQVGHIAIRCRAPIKKCAKCSKIGHDTDQCFAGSETSVADVV